MCHVDETIEAQKCDGQVWEWQRLREQPPASRPPPRLSLLAPCCSALVMLLFVFFGSVYTGGVGTIVCWWRLEIHNRVPRECHCRLLPQLAIVRPGAVAGWLPRQRSGGARSTLPLPTSPGWPSVGENVGVWRGWGRQEGGKLPSCMAPVGLSCSIFKMD